MSTTICPNPTEDCPAFLPTNSRKTVREVTPVYWRKLIEVGVPIDAARIIAWAIARYDLGKRLPTAYQQGLIQRYCRFVCRAELWRVNLLAASL
ncbi:MAG: hypothetical protein HC881_10570 [Leptolyngbyaceae cyanobacterium SL_7_1]|nr:hypothetical protein [Leptolyngbyaceae cyanobacterium SL_7_1]